MKYFVSSDIHGFYDEWMIALTDKGFDILNLDHKIIVCGDLFDRGKQPKQIIDFILKNKDKFILIKGNHEDLIEDMIGRNKSEIHDFHNGTADTFVDLYPQWMISEFDLKKISKLTGLEKILSMYINYFETSKHVFIHGWMPINYEDYAYNKNWRNATKEQWKKSRWLNPLEMYKNKFFEPNKTIVCGHWHCSVFWVNQYPNKYTEFGSKANFEPYITKDIMAIDACTAYSKKVNVVVIED